MPEKMCKKKTPDVFSANYSGICRCDSFGKHFADASGFLFGQVPTPFHEHFLQPLRQYALQDL